MTKKKFLFGEQFTYGKNARKFWENNYPMTMKQASKLTKRY
jgi:hypothetical protein